MDPFLAWVEAVPPWLVYAVLGLGAGVENVVPAIPADTFVVLGGFLSAFTPLSAVWVFAATWVCNVATALLVYRLGNTHGPDFFSEGWGRRILHPGQMRRVAAFYDRFGPPAIFLSRFLPGFRAVVPVFAGVTHQPLWPVAMPLTLASGIWYGALVWAGAAAGENLDAVRRVLEGVNRWLLGGALVVGALLAVAWWRTRHPEDGSGRA